VIEARLVGIELEKPKMLYEIFGGNKLKWNIGSIYDFF
jgi:hypothetical protein